MGFLKQRIYKNNIENNIDALKQNIRDAINEITVEMLHNVQKEFNKRLEKCLEVGGLHME